MVRRKISHGYRDIVGQISLHFIIAVKMVRHIVAVYDLE